jgi:fucose permease
MLQEYYEITPEKSSLFALIGGVAFLMTTPVAFYLRKNNFRRRGIIFTALLLQGVGMIIRTGNMQWLTNDSHIVMVFVGNFISGSMLSLLTTTVFPEMIDNLEQMVDYHEYDQD